MAQLRANHPARIAREAEQAETAFVVEIKKRCLDTGADANRIPAYLAEKIDICDASSRNYFNAPGKITLDIMRRVVQKISPDIGIVLRFLGYSDKEIKKYAADLTQSDTKAAVADFAKEFAKQLGGVMKEVAQ